MYYLLAILIRFFSMDWNRSHPGNHVEENVSVHHWDQLRPNQGRLSFFDFFYIFVMYFFSGDEGKESIGEFLNKQTFPDLFLMDHEARRINLMRE